MTEKINASAIDPKALVSTWRLFHHLQEDMETGEKSYPRGDSPQGLLTYTADGRFSIINVPGDRKAPADGLSPTDAEALALFKGLTAYAGRYSLDGEFITHHVEISWNELWSNTDQRRRIRLEGDTLTIIAGPSNSPWDGRLVRGTLTWARVRS